MSTAAPSPDLALNSPALRGEIARLRRVDNYTNLGYLAFEYLCLAAVVGLTAGFVESRESWGLSRAWNVPVFALAITLVGALQHRLAGLAHEASHYSLLKNKWANDVVGDAFCLIPMLATLHFYRLFHMAHHQYTNDPERDPDLINLGPGKRVQDFPMGRAQLIVRRLLAPLFSPVSFALFQWEYIYVNALGKGNNIYIRKVVDGDAASPLPRLGTILGGLYLLVVTAGQHVLTTVGRPGWLIPFGLGSFATAAIGARLLPDRYFFRAPWRQALSPRAAGLLRMGVWTGLLIAMALIREATGGRSSLYNVYVLWFVPLVTTFPYFLLLRDTYQHTNADDGRLTSTRVFFCDPLTRWAVFVYGQGMHVPHHLFPAVPHHRLGRLHEVLKAEHPEYAREVVECHGTFSNRLGLPTVVDVLTEGA